MSAKKPEGKAPQVVMEIPDLGLTARQISCLKKVFENALVASIGGASKVSKKHLKFPPKTIVQKKAS